MRILLAILTTLILTSSMVEAASLTESKIENIDLNIKDHEIAITFFNMSEGESTLIQGPNNENILVDAGGKSSESELEEWLSLYDVKEISTMIFTKGLLSLSFSQIHQLIADYKIKEIIATPDIARLLIKNMEEGNQLEIKAWEQGTKKVLLPELTAEVLFEGDGQNEGLDLALRFSNHRIFLMNSYSNRAEQTLLKIDLADVSILKLPNFVKEDTTFEKLIQNLNPEIAILVATGKNPPDPAVLNDLHETWSEVYVTKQHGTISIKFTKENYELITIPDDGVNRS